MNNEQSLAVAAQPNYGRIEQVLWDIREQLYHLDSEVSALEGHVYGFENESKYDWDTPDDLHLFLCTIFTCLQRNTLRLDDIMSNIRANFGNTRVITPPEYLLKPEEPVEPKKRF